MKKFSLLATLLILSSCSLFDEVDDVNFDTKLYQTIMVDNDATYNKFTYQLVIDASSNADIVRYQNKIKEYTISRITYTISDYSSSSPNSVTLNDGQLIFSSRVGASNSVLSNTLSVDLKGLSSIGTENTLIIDQTGLSSISDMLLSNSKVIVITTGTLSSTPIKFAMKITIHLTVRAGVL